MILLFENKSDFCYYNVDQQFLERHEYWRGRAILMSLSRPNHDDYVTYVELTTLKVITISKFENETYIIPKATKAFWKCETAAKCAKRD